MSTIRKKVSKELSIRYQSICKQIAEKTVKKIFSNLENFKVNKVTKKENAKIKLIQKLGKKGRTKYIDLDLTQSMLI